jgi:hypothetical protein
MSTTDAATYPAGATCENNNNSRGAKSQSVLKKQLPVSSCCYCST